jgi:hypothetical protein
MPSKGALAGKQLPVRYIARLAYEIGWTEPKNLVHAVAVCLAESQGYTRARNDNLKEIRDCDKGQVVCNVETLEHYTVVDPVKGILRYENGEVDTFPTEVLVVVSRDCGPWQINIPAYQIGTDAEERLYEPEFNVMRARQLFEERGFQPWVADHESESFPNGVAMDTRWYRKDGKPSGRYLHRALRGVANFLGEEFGLKPVPFTDFYKVPKSDA